MDVDNKAHRPYTVGRAVMRLLSRVNGGNEDDFLAPYETTQWGVAQAVDTSRAHASLELNRLIAKGFVECLVRRVPGLPTRRRTYRLTPAGVEHLNRLDAEVPVVIEFRRVVHYRTAPQSPMTRRLAAVEARLKQIEDRVLVEA